MNSAFVIKVDVFHDSFVGFCERCKLGSTQAFVFQNCMKRLDMCIFVRCLGWNEFVFHFKLFAG